MIGISSFVADPMAVYIFVVPWLQPMHALIVIARIKTIVIVYLDIAAAAAPRTDR
jgi:hypothetical protein